MLVCEGSVVMTLNSSYTTLKENFYPFTLWRLCLAPEPVKESLVWAFERSGAKARMPTIRLSRFCVLIVILECKSVRVSYYGDNSAHIEFRKPQLSQVILLFYYTFSRKCYHKHALSVNVCFWIDSSTMCA